MNALDQVAFVFGWGIKILRYIVITLITILLITALGSILFNFDKIVLFINNINLSFYIEKYDLMPIISGIITGLITFISMKYIDELNKKRTYYKIFAEKEVELRGEYCKSLEYLEETLPLIMGEHEKHGKLFIQGDIKIFLNEISKTCFRLHNIYKEMEIYFPFLKKGEYTEKFYLYLYLGRGFDQIIEGIDNGKLKVEFTDNKESFCILNLKEILETKAIYSLDKTYKIIQREVLSARKIYKKHR